MIAWGHGEKAASDKLLPVIYDELRRVAGRAMSHESTGSTLQPTALVHEAYLKLVARDRASYPDRSHFFGIAAHVMRPILVDHARERLASKRGSGAVHVTLEDIHTNAEGGGSSGPVSVQALHEELEMRAKIDPVQARLVELRYFTGLNIEETAEALDISPATVKREWVIARTWLRRTLEAM